MIGIYWIWITILFLHWNKKQKNATLKPWQVAAALSAGIIIVNIAKLIIKTLL